LRIIVRRNWILAEQHERLLTIEPLGEIELFEQVFVDEFGAICWPNGVDLAPDAVHKALLSAASTHAA